MNALGDARRAEVRSSRGLAFADDAQTAGLYRLCLCRTRESSSSAFY